MLFLIFTVTARVHKYLSRHAPTNKLISRLRRRECLKWAAPVALVIVLGYLIGADVCATIVNRGGPGWINLLVVLCVWNALKFAVLAPISLLRLARARWNESQRRHAAPFVPMGYDPARGVGPWTTAR